MLNLFKKITLVIVSFFFAQMSFALEIKTDNYNIYLGDVDGDGDGDYYFAQKPWTLILHGEIATPLVLKGTKNFVVYNNAGVLAAPQSFTLADADLATKLASGTLKLAIENMDFFLVSSSSGQRNLLLRSISSSTPAMLLHSFSNMDLPTIAKTYPTNTYIGISTSVNQLQIVDINGDGLNDILLKDMFSAETAYLADSNGIPERYLEVTPANYAPTVDATHVGTTAGQFRVDESGAATYTIPINIPEGVAGVKPQIALSYSSGGGNGIAGLGWSLSGLSAISRCRQTLSQDNNPQPITWTETDRFCLDGQRLILVFGTYGKANSTYKTEMDSVIEVKAVGGSLGHPDYFEVIGKDGSISTYGATPKSKLVGSATSNSTLTWAINRFQDNMKNAIEYVYENDAAGQRIKNIYYAYNSISTSTREASGAQASIQFTYKSRSDATSSYVSGFKFSQENLLESIQVYNKNSLNTMELLRNYNLGYMSSSVVANRFDNSLISRLISVQECRGTACYAPLTFDWGGGTHLAFNGGQSTTNEAKGYVGNPLFGDYDGDGVADFAYVYYKTNGDKYAKVKYSNQTDAGLLYLGSSNSVKISNIDYNLDGRMDIAYYKDSKWYIALSVPDQIKKWKLDFSAVNAIALPTDINASKLDVAFADINSDGAADVIYGNKYRLLERNTEPNSSNKAYSFLSVKPIDVNPAQMSELTAVYDCGGGNSGAVNFEEYKILSDNLADFNGDGRVDFLVRADGTSACFDEIGHVDFSAVYAVVSSGAQENLRFDVLSIIGSRQRSEIAIPKIQTVDVNSDGLTDIVKEQWSGNNLSLMLQVNNGAKTFNTAYEWKKLFSYKKDRSPQLADINGDGLADIITTNKNMVVMFGKYARDSNGNLLKDSAGNWLMTSTNPTFKNQSSDAEASQFMMDVSGDGVLDNILLGKSSVTLTYGAMSVPGAPIPCTPFFYYDSVIGEDVEGCEGGNPNPSDPLPSSQQYNSIYQINSGENFTKINYGTLAKSGRYTMMDVDTTVTSNTVAGWCWTNSYDEYECFDDVTYYKVDASQFYSRLNGGWELPSGSVTLASGNTKKDKPVLEVNGAMPIVTSVESTAPKAHDTLPYNVQQLATSKVDYYYAEAKMQAAGRGFLGFARLKTVDAQTGVTTITNYRQDFPFIGSPLSTTVYSDASANAKVISHSINKWNFKLAPGATLNTNYYFPFLDDSIEQTFDVSGTSNEVLQTVTVDNTYNGYGNLADVITTTSGKKADGSDTSLKQTIKNYYGTTDTNYQYYGRLTKTEVETSRDGSTPVKKTSTFTYYPFGGDYNFLLESEIVKKSDQVTNEVETVYQYDQFGNKTKVSVTAQNSVGVNETRNTFNTYSTDGRYLISTRNDLSQSAQITARNEYGQAVSGTDSNGIPSGTTYYDAMGNQYMQKNADGSWSRTESRWCNPANGISCPVGAVYRTRSRASGGGEAIEYFDVLGRTIRSSKRHFDGNWSNVDTEYDNLSRVKRQSIPFISNSSTSGQATAWTTTEFDNYGRPTKVKAPDNSESRMEYSGNITTSINAKNQKKYETKNGLGQLVKVQDELGGVIEYEYDVYGGLLKATTKADGSSISVRMCYDHLGRKTAMLDPDKGGTRAASGDATIACSPDFYQRTGWWTYKYNGFGELVEQADPKGQRTQMHYDKLGRMVGRVDVLANGSIESFTQWFYEKGVGAQATGINGKLTAVVMDSSPGLTTTQINNALTNGVATCSQTSSYCHKTINEFDVLTRPRVTKTYYPGSATEYVSRVDYDSLGRAYKQYDALDNQLTENGSKIASGTQTSFNDYGYAQRVRDIASGTLLSEVKAMNARGQVTQEFRGNGVDSINTYNDLTGLLTNQQATIGAWTLQNMTYKWDDIGNLQYRINQASKLNGSGTKNNRESFCYDALNRLTKTVAGVATTTPTCASPDMVYDGFGNIKNKNGVAYTYSNVNAGPHAVTTAGSATYTYDANGNAITGDGRGFEYTSYDMASKITKGSDYVEFKYGPDRARWKRTDKKGSSTTHTTYIGNIERIETLGTSEIEWKRYIGGAIFTYKTNLSNQVQSTDKSYVYNDHLGSVDVITNAVGTIRSNHSMSFDAWGSRRSGEDWSNWNSLSDSERATAITNALAVPNFSRPITTRGYTGHEMVDDMGIIHMNGRIYDAKLGRFLQADPVIDGVKDTQGYNRYSYVRNNPLNATDPSGFSAWSKFRDKWLKPIVAVVLTVVTYGAASAWAIGIYGAGCTVVCSIATANIIGGIVGGAAAGFVGGASMAAFGGASVKDSFKAGFKGAAAGALMGGVNGYLGSTNMDTRVIRGLSGGINGALQNENGEGFMRGFFAAQLSVDMGLKSYYTNRFTNFMVNRTREALQGYIINGKDGARQNVEGGLANTAIGHAVGLYSSKGTAPTFRDGVEVYEDRRGVFKYGGAITIGNVVSGNQADLNDPEIFAHELGHFYNQSNLGAYYLPIHGLSVGLGTLTSGLFGVKNNPFFFMEQKPFKDIPYSELY
jgi:RHS repeat-associated protein